MFPRSLQWRLVLIFILITILLVIPIGLLLNNRVEKTYYSNFKAGIDDGFKQWSIRSDATVEELEKSVDDYKSIFNVIGRNKSYTIIDRNEVNEIKASSDFVYNEFGRDEFVIEILDSKNLFSAMKGEKIADSDELVRSHGRSFFDYARLITISDGEYILYFRYHSDAWSDITKQFNDIIFSSLIFAIIFSLVVGYALSKTITVPIQRITYKAESLAAGEFDQMLEVKSKDEIGKLTGSFNYMAKSLKKTLAEISSEKNKVETILNYMTDGVIAFNIRGEMIHINPAAREITGSDTFNGTFNDFSSKYGLDIKIEELVYLNSFSTKEASIKVDDRIIRVYFAMFADEGRRPEGIIAVLQDVTEQEKLEAMRKEFVANVSHELRTPLTSIKSYAETLLDGALEDRETSERFLRVINSESDRMTRLVRDLLHLSRLDNKQMKWNMKTTSIVKIVKRACERMEIEAQGKNQTLECHIMNDIPNITIDHDRIEQVLLNIISNAIKYTPDGGKISVYLSKMYNEVLLKVADNGIGIPEKDLPRIFERFYRVDKARSREMGGTGLGLAIAKEIVEAHSGTMTIKSELDKGTEITVKLPVNV